MKRLKLLLLGVYSGIRLYHYDAFDLFDFEWYLARYDRIHRNECG